MPRMSKFAKLGRELPGLDEPPFDTPLGQRIYESISAEAWRMWSEHSKMLLNEYRLQPWKPEAQQFLVEQMEAFFFGSGSSLPKEYVPPKSSSSLLAANSWRHAITSKSTPSYAGILAHRSKVTKVPFKVCPARGIIVHSKTKRRQDAKRGK